ncbi:hypothetical protein IWW52_003752 [Coemansia sp. RSA 2704]|nr:hypothetical protein IWW52_003752 [Coemansia sp. RSA 2704]
MEAEVPASALKKFYKALQCLSRVSNDISIEAHPEHLELSTVNAARSAFASFTFRRNFFDVYELGRQQHSAQSGATLQCKVLAKPLVGIFKSRGAGQSRAVEKCILRIEQDTGSIHAGSSQGELASECRLVVRVAYKEGICRTHRMYYELGQTLHPVYDRRDFKSHWRVGAKVAADWVSHFARGLSEVSFWMSASQVQLRSWSEGQYVNTGRTQIDAIDTTQRSLLTELTLVPAEFDVYELAGTHPIELTFSLREFRALLQYAEAMDMPLTARFNKGGDPLMLGVGTGYASSSEVRSTVYTQTSDEMSAEILIATQSTYGVSQPGSSAQGTPRNQQAADAPPATIQSFETPLRPMVCDRVDEISVASEDRHSRPSTQGLQGGNVSVYEIDPKLIPSPSPFQSSRGSSIHDLQNMEIGRPDSRSNYPPSAAGSRRANSAHSPAGGAYGAPSTSGGSGAAASQPEFQTPVRGAVQHTQNARSYRLQDMPRPQAPPGVTEALFEERTPGSAGSVDDLAPPGRVQTRLPYRGTSAARNQNQRQQATTDESNTDMSSDDEELDATPPPASKRLRSLF